MGDVLFSSVNGSVLAVAGGDPTIGIDRRVLVDLVVVWNLRGASIVC
jgi:hypothetical protein